MKSNGQIPAIIQYITEHPGSYMTDILRDTKIPKFSVTSALSKLTGAKTLRREGYQKRYRYYVADPEAKTTSKAKQATYEHDRVNPLTNLFNQRLKEIRSGR
ncbi:hypothetical protein [Lelliottia amnigena]|uniref:hypothetical protein n=1 Tax=Lelliottia amnigena TaxID=61646 RepID=UPI0040571B8F